MKLKLIFSEFWLFIIKELRACIFPGGLIFILLISNNVTTFGLAKYDFLFLMSIVWQFILLMTKIISFDELKVIFLFAILGLGMEFFKTHPQIAYWVYSDDAFFKITTVPLYVGFLHASVASYVVQARRQFKLKFLKYQTGWSKWFLGLAIYLNFFTKHYFFDLKYFLLLVVFLLNRKAKVRFTLKKTYQLSLLIAFLLIGSFLWLAENMVTFWGAWQYHYQIAEWQLVKLDKIIAWFLFFIVSFILVTELKFIKDKKKQRS